MKPQLSIVQRNQIKMSFECGVKPSHIAKLFNVSSRTVKNICKKKELERKKYDSTNRFKITEQNKVEIEDYLMNNSKCSTMKIKQDLQLDASKSTINKSLKDMGIKSYVQRKRSNIPQGIINSRLQYCLGTFIMHFYTFNLTKKF